MSLSPRQRVAAALAAQELQQQTACAPVPHFCGCQPLPLEERPTGEATLLPCGQRSVKDFGKLVPPVQELVRTGATLATTPITQQPLTRTELESERASLLREARIIGRRLRQVNEELESLPPAA